MWRNGLGALGAAVGLGGLIAAVQGRSKDGEANNEIRVQRMQEAAQTKPIYTGIKRENEANSLTEKLKESLVVLYHPTTSGKSHIAEYLQSNPSRPVLYLRGKPTLETTLQQWDSEPGPTGNIRTFQRALYSALVLTPTPLLILDSLEKSPSLLRQALIFTANRLKQTTKADALVITSDIETVEMARICGEIQVHIPDDLSENEFTAIAEQINVNITEAKGIYLKWGPDLDILTHSKADPDYTNHLFQDYLSKVRTILTEKPDLQQPFIRIFETVTARVPLGNTFAGSVAAEVLYKAGLLVPFPNKSMRFRSKVAAAALREGLISN